MFKLQSLFNSVSGIPIGGSSVGFLNTFILYLWIRDVPYIFNMYARFMSRQLLFRLARYFKTILGFGLEE